MAGATLEEIVISYQSNQEVEAIRFYTNGKLRNEIQIIYQAENQTLSSVISLDHRSKLMEIIRF
jgi:antitoxin component YwqK of YwqJK toxin-antitoxin module